MTSKTPNLIVRVITFGIFALAGGTLLFIYLHLDIAPELSDSSYYIINITTPQHIDNQLTMFGPVWYSFFGPIPLIASRLLYLGILFSVGALFGWRCAAFLSDKKWSLKHVMAAAFGGSCFLFYYCWALFDPNYNGLVLVFYVGAVICALPFMQAQTSERALSVRSFITFALAFGACITFVALVKISSAALMVVFFVLLLASTQITNLRDTSQLVPFAVLLLKLVFWSLLGVVLPIFLIWARLFDPAELWQHLENGYESTALIGGYNFTFTGLWGQYTSYLSEIKTSFLRFPALFILLVSPFVIHTIWGRKSSFHRRLSWISLGIFLICCVILIHSARTTDSARLLSLFTALRVCALALGLGALLSLPAKRSTQFWAFIACILCGPFLMSAGTNNAWVWQFSSYSGLAIAFMGTVIMFCPWPRQALYLPSAIALTILALTGAYSAIENHPYRLGGRLSQAHTSIFHGADRIPMRAPASLAASYLALEAVTPHGKDGPSPVFIDLTGRAPGIGLHLGLRPPKVAWTLSGYPGSDAYFDFALSRLTEQDIAEAWILLPDLQNGEYHGLSQDILNSYLHTASGLSFPADYKPLAQVPIAYIERGATLYKPKE